MCQIGTTYKVGSVGRSGILVLQFKLYFLVFILAYQFFQHIIINYKIK